MDSFSWVKIEEIMNERFGHDSLISLATVDNGMPSVRVVDALYENRAFYIITHALSNKMKQLGSNPNAAIAGDWFTAHGTAVNLGWFCSEENRGIAEKLRAAFASWIDNGHNDFSDKNTCILCIRLTDGVLCANERRYDIDFTVGQVSSN